MSEQQPEQPEVEVPAGAAMVISQLVITRVIDEDGDDAVVVKGANGMTLLEVLGTLEFAKVWVTEAFKNSRGDDD